VKLSECLAAGAKLSALDAESAEMLFEHNVDCPVCDKKQMRLLWCATHLADDHGWPKEQMVGWLKEVEGGKAD
jgi:hypothetical protein